MTCVECFGKREQIIHKHFIFLTKHTDYTAVFIEFYFYSSFITSYAMTCTMFAFSFVVKQKGLCYCII